MPSSFLIKRKNNAITRDENDSLSSASLPRHYSFTHGKNANKEKSKSAKPFYKYGSACLTIIIIAILLLLYHNTSRYEFKLDTNSFLRSAGSKVQIKKRIQHNPPIVYFAGIVKDVRKVRNQVWETVFHFNCNAHIGIHIIAKEGNIDHVLLKQRDYIQKMAGNYNGTNNTSIILQQCAPIILINENDISIEIQNQINHVHNRIDRISILRDYQRKLLTSLYPPSDIDTTEPNSVVLITDFDLLQLPPKPILNQTIENLMKPLYPHDALCAAGADLPLSQRQHQKEMQKQKKKIRNMKLWYYDTFATIFLPDTFAFPVNVRYISSLYKGEDPSRVRSNDKYGNFTMGDMMQFIQDKAEEEKVNTKTSDGFRVKSCFGGITAYRSSKYFTKSCKYSIIDDYTSVDEQNNPLGLIVDDPNTSLMRYANAQEKRPCEHVVFHDCLRRHYSDNFNIAIHPKLISLWKYEKSS